MASILTRGAGRRQKQQARAPAGARRGVHSADKQETVTPASLKRPRTGSTPAESDRPGVEQLETLTRGVREAAADEFDPGGGGVYGQSDTESEMKEEPPGDEFVPQTRGTGQDLANDEDITHKLAAMTAKNDQLRTDMRGLKRKFSQRKKDYEKIRLRVSALSNVASELSVLQNDYQEYSRKNVALVQELLAQIGHCADQVDSLKQSRDLTRAELREFRVVCTQEMTRLMQSLDELRGIEERSPARGYVEANKSFAMDSAAQSLQFEQQQRSQQLGYDQNSPVYSNADQTAFSQQVEGGFVPGEAQVSRIDVVSSQLDELRDQIFHIQQGLQQNNQSFRQQLEDLLAQEMTRIREVQDDEAERMYEEVDDLRSGMIAILKDMHILKERTKYMVPNMSKMGGARLRRHRKPPVSSSSPSPIRVRDARPAQGGTNTPGYSLMMTTRMCDNKAPHLEHGYSSDWYCPGIPEVEMPVPSNVPGSMPQATVQCQGGGDLEQVDDMQWVQYREGDTRRELDHPPFPPCESPHYSSRSSGVSDRLSVNEDHVVPVEAPDEDLERRLLEQHRQFWIVEGAG